ncbi:MAG: PIN domain-containing protein [archaeon]
MDKKKKGVSEQIKRKARRGLNRQISTDIKTYVIDTNVAINQSIRKLIKRGLKGKFIIPNAVMAELENLANKGVEAGFIGLEEITMLHQLKKHHNFSVYFEGLRPNEHQIKFAKSGEIDALIREIARKNNATLITADLVQAKTAQAYNVPVLFIRKNEPKEKKKGFFIFGKK